jgi:hypothetical protein
MDRESEQEVKVPVENTNVKDRERVSKHGISAIRGDHLVPEDNQQIITSIREISPTEEVIPDENKLDSAAQFDLDIAAKRADAEKSVRYHETEIPGRVCEYRRIRSGITEVLAAENMPGSIRSDRFSESGTNYPNYDIFTPDEFASVKALSYKDGEPRKIYRQFFLDIINPDSQKNQKAAERLVWVRDHDQALGNELSNHLPQELTADSDIQTIQKILSEKGTLRIPEDQVEKVKEDLKFYFKKHPEKVPGTDPDSHENHAVDIEQMIEDRIRSIDKRYTTAHFQAKAADLVSLRDEDLAGLARKGRQ